MERLGSVIRRFRCTHGTPKRCHAGITRCHSLTFWDIVEKLAECEVSLGGQMAKCQGLSNPETTEAVCMEVTMRIIWPLSILLAHHLTSMDGWILSLYQGSNLAIGAILGAAGPLLWPWTCCGLMRGYLGWNMKREEGKKSKWGVDFCSSFLPEWLRTCNWVLTQSLIKARWARLKT